jgi:hypothetical protein
MIALSALILLEVLQRLHLLHPCRHVFASDPCRALERFRLEFDALRLLAQPTGGGVGGAFGIVYGPVTPHRPQYAGKAASQRNGGDALAASSGDRKRPTL